MRRAGVGWGWFGEHGCSTGLGGPSGGWYADLTLAKSATSCLLFLLALCPILFGSSSRGMLAGLAVHHTFVVCHQKLWYRGPGAWGMLKVREAGEQGAHGRKAEILHMRENQASAGLVSC